VALIVANVVQQHADDAASLASNRTGLTDAPYAKVQRLLSADRRLAAHLEGLRLAGEHASSFCEALLENPSSGAAFVLAISALEAKDPDRFDQLMALAQAVPETLDGLLCALGWVDGPHLEGVVASLLRHREGFRRMVGVAACAMHRVDPGLSSGAYFEDPDPTVRARSLRAAGELGLSDLMSSCAEASRGDADREPRFWAAWSAVLLGDRQIAVDEITAVGLSSGPHRNRSFRLAIQAMSTSAAHRILQDLSADTQQTRWVIQGSGIAGDPTYAPWLIKRMADLNRARLSAEAFTLITGVDLGAQALDLPAPVNFESGPSDDPEDPDVDMDPDEGLPWPNAAKIEEWWAANNGRFQKGTRYFMGEPVTREHCINVLKTGYQRQRILAAHYLCLLDPGTPLFNTSAPAWRQQRLLAAM
jgi:uncharacterized protein (TIGR02270 family)